MKRRQVRIHPDFEADFRAQVDWLGRHAEARWIDWLSEGVEELVELLSELPFSGEPVAGARGALRKLLFRRGPYVAWYAVDGDEVWLLRLFHARQRRQKPNLARWFSRR